LASFITGLEIQSLSAELTSFGEGRVLDDDAMVHIRYEGGSKGTINVSQICIGEENSLSVGVFGDKGSIRWSHDNPNDLRIATLDSGVRLITRGQAGLSERAAAATRTPPGHPEGYLEAFANIYRGVAELIGAKNSGSPIGPLGNDVPGPEAGIDGMRFVERVIESSNNDGAWV